MFFWCRRKGVRYTVNEFLAFRPISERGRYAPTHRDSNIMKHAFRLLSLSFNSSSSKENASSLPWNNFQGASSLLHRQFLNIHAPLLLAPPDSNNKRKVSRHLLPDGNAPCVVANMKTSLKRHTAVLPTTRNCLSCGVKSFRGVCVCVCVCVGLQRHDASLHLAASTSPANPSPLRRAGAALPAAGNPSRQRNQARRSQVTFDTNTWCGRYG